MIEEPAPRQINSWSVAEENAATWMKYWGHVDAACTTGGADGGVDVRSRTALAQVKFEATQVGSPAVQRLVGARGKGYHLALFFFSGAGYARPAIEYADMMEVALFTYDLTGRPTAVNQVAREGISVSSGRPKRSAIAARAAASRANRVHREPMTTHRWRGHLSDVAITRLRESITQGRKSGASMFLRVANPDLGPRQEGRQGEEAVKADAEDFGQPTQTPDASKDSGVMN